MTTETKRDLRADQVICEAASVGPWLFDPGNVPEWDGGDEGGILAHNGEYVCDFGDSTQYYPTQGTAPSPADVTFITEARTGWPHAIERAINTERWLLALVEALERGDIAQTRLSSGTDYVVYCAKKAVGR